MTEELKPCPFCGKEAVIEERDDFYRVRCENFPKCPASICTPWFDEKYNVVEMWNRRVKE